MTILLALLRTGAARSAEVGAWLFLVCAAAAVGGIAGAAGLGLLASVITAPSWLFRS